MTDHLSNKDQKLLWRLRRMRILVIHPEDSDRQVLIDHLKRIGCQADSVWPAPESLPKQTDVVLFLINRLEGEGSLAWMAGTDSIARIAIISYETPEILIELERFHVHGVLSKPIRVFGVLAALTIAVSMAQHENRLKKRVDSLDKTLKARRSVERAVSILSKSKDITEDEAYKRLRQKSMKDKCSIASIAEAIVASDDI